MPFEEWVFGVDLIMLEESEAVFCETTPQNDYYFIERMAIIFTMRCIVGSSQYWRKYFSDQ